MHPLSFFLIKHAFVIPVTSNERRLGGQIYSYFTVGVAIMMILDMRHTNDVSVHICISNK